MGEAKVKAHIRGTNFTQIKNKYYTLKKLFPLNNQLITKLM